MIDYHDIIWLAGLFEGEGSISIRGASVTLRLAMTDEDVVRRCQAVTGMGTIVIQDTPNRPNWKRQWFWKVDNKPEAARLMLAMYPLLGERRRERVKQAIDAMYGRHRVYHGKEPDHGTVRGYTLCRRRNGKACDQCKEAFRLYSQEYRAKRRQHADN